jgi:catechol-2,3-dioxygenase
MASKPRFAHVVFRTNQLARMVDWYCDLLGARVVFRNERLAMVTFDDEHHRVALVAAQPYAPPAEGQVVGFHHVAFSLHTLDELLGLYERLKRSGRRPARSIHHGPTMSLYFADPDGNMVEMQVDAFADPRACEAWMQGPEFAANPIGIDVDPEWLIRQKQQGVSDEFLLKRANMPLPATNRS